MQNDQILILIVLDKKKKFDLDTHESLPSYYALDSIAILYRYYANTYMYRLLVQWLYMQI